MGHNVIRKSFQYLVFHVCLFLWLKVLSFDADFEMLYPTLGMQTLKKKNDKKYNHIKKFKN